MTSQLVFRCDASPEIGVGHLIRCLALALAWRAGRGHAHFFVSQLPDPLKQRLQREGITVHWQEAALGPGEDGRRTADLARWVGARWVVTDGYRPQRRL